MLVIIVCGGVEEAMRPLLASVRFFPVVPTPPPFLLQSRLQSCSSFSAVNFVDPECLNTAPHPLIAVRTEERSWRGAGGAGGAGGHLDPLIPRLGVMMEGVVHVDQPGYPVNIVVAGGDLQPQV